LFESNDVTIRTIENRESKNYMNDEELNFNFASNESTFNASSSNFIYDNVAPKRFKFTYNSIMFVHGISGIILNHIYFTCK
jgi:hypothetical protein